MIDRMPSQAVNMGRLIGGHQVDCYDNLRMDRNAFGRLCVLLRSRGGLVDGRHVTVEEQVAMFLSILAHHKKNRVVKFNHQRSGQTVSQYVHAVLLAVLKMHTVLFVKPDPVPTDSTNPRWKWFKQSNGFGSGTGVGGSKKGSGGTRRVWAQREEKVLMDALKDLVVKGQKSDNGFRTGYLTKLEIALRKAFPGTDLQATPHITSKITTWRKHYSSIVSAKRLATGVGFNTTTNQLECTDDLWDAIVKKDPTMKLLRHKEWPYFVDWIDIFGKDRATGETAEEVPEAIGEMDETVHPNVNNTQESNDANESGINKNPTQAQEEQEENSASRKGKGVPRSRSANKKRRSVSDQSDPRLTKLFGEFCKNTGDRLETIASRIGYDHDLGVARKQIYKQLGNIDGLSIKDKLDVSKIIGGKVETLEIWTTLPDEARVVFVMDILGRS
ncbi:hypothetical protein ACS0TY_001873 [Phlomoides rotata]